MKVYPESCEWVIPISYGNTEIIETGKWGYQKPETVERAAPCEASCPAGNPIARFIHLIREERYDSALEILLKENPFPGVCGRVCFHPCEKDCNRNQYDEAVSINALERYVFDKTMDRHPPLHPIPHSSPRRVAIVGAGPAGLSCAYFLALLGHRVTLFEARQEPGGVLRWGIPEYRLPKSILKREIERILGLGIELKTGVRVGKDISMEAFSPFDGLFLSPGAGFSLSLGIEGEHLSNVWSGTDFLNRINSGGKVRVGKEVLVIGGGNTAMDVARSARRLGSSVTVAYRRTKKEMPAIIDEVKEAEQEGIHFEFLLQPVEIRSLPNRRIRVKLQRMRLKRGKPAERPQPIPIKGRFVSMEVDRLIQAVGEGVDLSWVPQDLKEDGFLKRSFPRRQCFSGGDAVNQHRSVVMAISSGKRAAISLDLSFRGLDIEEVLSKIRVGSKSALSMEAYVRGLEKGFWEEPKPIVTYDQLNPLFFTPSPRGKLKKIDPEKALKGFAEVYQGLSTEEAKRSASRCFSCGTCNDCFNCYYFCPEGIVSFDSLNHTRKVDLDHCKGCGICSRACPRHVIEMRLIS